MVAEDEGLLVGLLAGEEVEEGGACFDSAGESGAVRVEGEFSHGGKGAKSFGRVVAAGEVGDDGVP